MRRTITLDLTADHKVGNELVASGGVFAAGAPLRLDEECNLVLRAGHEELRLVARAVLVNDRGSGLEIVGLTTTLRDQISAFARVASYIAVMRDAPARARTGQDTVPMMPPQAEAAAPAKKGEIVERVRNVRYDDEPRLAAGSTAPRTKPTPAGGVAVGPSLEPPVAYAPTQEASTLAAKAEAAQRAARDDD